MPSPYRVGDITVWVVPTKNIFCGRLGYKKVDPGFTTQAHTGKHFNLLPALRITELFRL